MDRARRKRSHTRLIVRTRRDSNNDKLGYPPWAASTDFANNVLLLFQLYELARAPSGSPVRCISYRWLWRMQPERRHLLRWHRNYFNLSINANITVTNYYPRCSFSPTSPVSPQNVWWFRKSNCSDGRLPRWYFLAIKYKRQNNRREREKRNVCVHLTINDEIYFEEWENPEMKENGCCRTGHYSHRWNYRLRNFMDFLTDRYPIRMIPMLFFYFWPFSLLRAIYLSFHTTRARTRYLYLAGLRTRDQHYTIKHVTCFFAETYDARRNYLQLYLQTFIFTSIASRYHWDVTIPISKADRDDSTFIMHVRVLCTSHLNNSHNCTCIILLVCRVWHSRVENIHWHITADVIRHTYYPIQ